MSEITNEQRLYVLLKYLRRKTPKDKCIWSVVSRNTHESHSWMDDTIKELRRDEYLDYGIGMSRKEVREVYSTTSSGKDEIPKLWRASKFRTPLFSKVYKYILAVITMLITALVTAFAKDLYDFIKETSSQ